MRTRLGATLVEYVCWRLIEVLAAHDVVLVSKLVETRALPLTYLAEFVLVNK